MFKLVVLCAFFAAAAAKPGLLIPAPYTQYSTYIAPATTTISKHDSSVIHPSPLIYSAPVTYTHFIKKRSPQFPLSYAAPATYYPNYWAGTTYASAYNTPLIQSSSLLTTPAVHLIKKRSAALIPTTYYASGSYAAPAPLLTSTYTAHAPIYSQTPLISQPIGAYTHFIKKRSAGLLTPYIAPASYSHQSRFDLQTSNAPVTSISYASPFAYSSPYALSHVY